MCAHHPPTLCTTFCRSRGWEGFFPAGLWTQSFKPKFCQRHFAAVISRDYLCGCRYFFEFTVSVAEVKAPVTPFHLWLVPKKAINSRAVCCLHESCVCVSAAVCRSQRHQTHCSSQAYQQKVRAYKSNIPFVTTLQMGASGFSRSKIKEPGRSLYSGRHMSKTEPEKEKLLRGLHTS